MSSLRIRVSVLAAALVVVLLGGGASGQSITGSVSGTVTDSSGAIVPGAAVTLIGEQTGETRNLTTNDDGRFNFSAVQPGVYKVRVELQGFQSLLQERVILSANENLALGELKLQPGQVTETVTVASAGAVVETESSDLTARLTADQINLISTKGRDVTSLLRLLPGTSNNDDIEAVGEGFGTDLPNISGQRGRSTVSTVDGLNASEPSGSNKLSMTINQDAVAEVKVLRNNYGAEYGNNGGAHHQPRLEGRRAAITRAPPTTSSATRRSTPTPSSTTRRASTARSTATTSGASTSAARCRCRRSARAARTGSRTRRSSSSRWRSPTRSRRQDPRFVTVPTALEREGDFSQSINSANNAVSVRDPSLAGNCSASDRPPASATLRAPRPRTRWAQHHPARALERERRGAAQLLPAAERRRRRHAGRAALQLRRPEVRRRAEAEPGVRLRRQADERRQLLL